MIAEVEDEDTFLQTDWIDEIEKYTKEYSSFYKDDVFSIKIVKIFVSVDKMIHHVSCETMDLYTKNTISREQLTHTIKTSNSGEKKKYKLDKVYLYNIDTEPDHLHKFIESDMNGPLIREINFHKNIYIRPTITQFQKLNCLYFLLRELSDAPNYKVTKKNKSVTFATIKPNTKTRKNLH